MKLPSLSRLPKFKIPAKIQWSKSRPRRLQAVARRAVPAIEDYDQEEPTTKLSSAFIVVLILHVVAVGGIYAFNEIKKNRRREEPLASVPAKPAAQKPAAPADPQTATGNNVIPASTTAAPAAAPAPSPAMMPVGGSRVHQVRAGDNLTKIAAQHSVSIADLAELNGIKETTTLRPGQTLNLPAKSAAPGRTAALATPRAESTAKKPDLATASKTATGAKPDSGATVKPVSAANGAKTYIVKKGDNPVAIARKLNVSYDELLKLNKIEDPKKLKPDQVLKVPAAK